MALDLTKQPPITGQDPVSQAMRQLGQTLPSTGDQIVRLQRMLLASEIDVGKLVDPTTHAIADLTTDADTPAYAKLAAQLGAGWTVGHVKTAIAVYTQAGGYFSLANPAVVGAVQQ